METKTKKVNRALNFLKGIACFGVVFIHVKFPGVIGDIVLRLSQFAVPIFFMISGYFAYSTDAEWCAKTLMRRMKKMFYLSVVSSLVYTIVTLGWQIHKGILLQSIDAVLWSKIVTKFIFMNNLDLINAPHLWFLWALAYTYIVLIVINRWNAWGIGYRLMYFLFMVQILLFGLGFYEAHDWHYRANWLISAIPYVLLGHYIAAHKAVFATWSNKFNVLLISGGGRYQLA